MRAVRATLGLFVAAVSATLIAAAAPQVAGARHDATTPLCHVTDGAFTACADGTTEWSNVTPAAFPSSNSYLYAEQADLDPALAGPDSAADTLMLMYDECSTRTPLGPNEYVLVSFKTVEKEDGVEELRHYAIHLFGDGTIVFIENGEPQRDDQGRLRVREIEGQRGAVGFGTSPTCAFDHVIGEFEIKLTAAVTLVNGGYSPDPIFWSSDPPPPKECSVTPLPALTDPQAQQIEQPETFSNITVNGHPVSVSSRALLGGLTASMRAALDDFLTRITNTPGAGVPRINSAFRPQAYQDHLRAIRDRATQLGARVNGGNVTFTNNDDECAAVRQDIANELLNHGLGNNPVARVSDHGSGNAVDVRVTLPAGTSIDDLAAQAGLRRPLPVRDPVHFIPAPQPPAPNPGTIIIRSPVNVLVTDPNGRRIGFGINEIGDGATDSGPATEPERFDFEEMLPGTYKITGAGRGVGPYTIEVLTATSNSVLLGEGSVQGTTAPLQPLDPVDVTVGADGEVTLAPGTPEPTPGVVRPGFGAVTFGGNDDGSTGRVPIGFDVNFFGSSYSSLFVNNNGNVTFDLPLGTFTPFDLSLTNRAIIAPFFGDVDTRPFLSGKVTFGQAAADGRPAFGVTWPGVGCYNQNAAHRNFFQVVLVDRSDVAAGDFDIEFNYFSIEWETGQASSGNADCLGGDSARAGFSNGSRATGTFFELPGSGIPGALLNGNPATGLIHNSLNSGFDGRYVFPVRNGEVATAPDSDADTVQDDLDNCPTTPNTDQRDVNQNGRGDACDSGGHGTAAFLQAGFDGTTAVEPTSVAVADEPPILDQLVRIVRFRIAAGLIDDAKAFSEQLVDSLVEAGVVEPGAAEGLVDDVLAGLDTTPPVVTLTVPAADGQGGWFVSSPVTATVSADDTTTGGNPITGIECTGAVVGPVTGLGTPTASAAVTVSGDGVANISCTATDAPGNTGNATATVRIDTTAPHVACTATPKKLWPPNHKLVAVTTQVTASDTLSGASGFTLLSVRSSESDNGNGDGNTTQDIQGFVVGMPDTAGLLRAERSGGGPGRIYTLRYGATDAAGNSAACATTVTVPHDQG